MGTDESPIMNSHELGRMTEQMRNLTVAVQDMKLSVQDMSKNFASQRDLDRVEEMAVNGQKGAERANTRLDSLSFWEKIAVAVLAAIILYVLRLNT